MDWMSFHNVVLDCANKAVFIPPTDKDISCSHSFIFDDVRFLSVSSIQGYMLHSLAEMKSGLSIEAIPVVNEFSEVFLDDITTLPPEREV
jgi:hypothetical protein